MSRPETGRRAAWTEERGTSDEGRRRNPGAPAEGGRYVSRPETGRRAAPAEGGRHVSLPGA
jgi:hypothetical protein